MNPTPALEIDGLCFRYPGGPEVLSEVSLSVARGERFGLLGPNGSGKSTLLRLASGVLRPARGRIRILGHDLASLEPGQIARRVAVVPQETALDFPFSVLEVVLMGRSPHLGPLGFESERDLEVASRVMAETGVHDLAGRWFHELSGGEKQRVVIARALAQDPEILLLDEPTTFLDILHEVEIFDLLTDLSERGLTVIVVLHDLNLAGLLCERLAFLKRGRVHASGAVEEVLTYRTIKETYDVEVFVGTNELTGRLNVLPLGRRHREELRRRFGEGRPR